MIGDPEKILTEPDPVLVKEGRCGRWHRDGKRTRIGKPTRKQEALAKIETARGAGKTPAQLEALARRLAVEARKDKARCRETVKETGAACKQRHGGKSPRGVDSPHFKNGEYSIERYLRPKQSKAFKEWLDDPRRFDHARQGASLEALLVNQISRLHAPALVEWKLVADGWDKLQAAGRLAATGKEADKKAAKDLQRDGLAMIGQGVGGFDVERDNADAVKVSETLIMDQSRVTARENLRTHREQEVITLQQHVAQQARAVEVLWQTAMNDTRGMNARDTKLVRGVFLSCVAALRAEGDRCLEGPKGPVN